MNNPIFRPLLLLFLLLSAPFMRAQTERFYSTESGLSSSLVNQLFQDSRGYVWIATEYGLNCFDGLHFTTYRSLPGDTTTIRNNYVRTLFEDDRQNLLVGCIDGLMRYDRATDSFHEIPLMRDGKRVNPHVTQMRQLRNGELWVVTSGQGLFRIERDLSVGVHQAELMKHLNYFNFNSLYEDMHGYIWVGTEQRGLTRYRLPDGSDVKHYRYPAIADDCIMAIGEDTRGTLFVGTLKGGLLRYDREADTFHPVPYAGGKSLSVYCLEVVDGRLLVGTDGDGLKRYDPDRQCLEDCPLSTGLRDYSAGKVHSIMEDREGNLWLGLFQKGVALMTAGQNQFGYYGEKLNRNNPIGTGCVMALYRDADRHLWVGTDNEGLYELDAEGQRVRHYRPSAAPDGVPSVVTCLHRDSEDNFWLGSYTRGVARLDRRTGRCTYPLNIANERIYSIVEDADKHLYIGTLGAGFYRYDLRTGRLQHYESSKDDRDDLTRDELANDWVNSLFCDSEGLLWIGHYRGVSCFNPRTGSFLNYGGRNRQISGCVGYALQEDAEGNIWAGTTDGLYRFDKKSGALQRFTEKEGLPNNVVCGICEDESGDLWLSTYMGISRYDRKEQRFINYYSADGLQGNEFAHGAYHKDRDGRIYFGGMSGITFFHPATVGPTAKNMQVWITGFSIFNRPVHKGTLSGGRQVVETAVQDAHRFCLAHRDNTFSLTFSTLQYNNTEQIAYQYRIEELGRQWLTTAPGVNRVTYNNLPPGTYHFSVRAMTHGTTSGERTVEIHILPPWYATWWAYIIYVLLLALLVWGAVNILLSRMRHRREIMKREHAEQLNEAKLQFFINISHEIRTPMTLIINPLEKLLADCREGELQKNYQMIYRNAQRILRLINQLMDIRKLDKGQMQMHMRETDMVGFVADLMQTFEYMARKKRIRFTFEHDMEQLKVWVDLNNFDKILMNILSNAFKYTPEEGEIRVSLLTGKDPARRDALQRYFEITVEDSGIGIDRDQIERIFERFYQIENDVTKSNFGTGIGLHLSRSLVRLHHGVILAENREDTSGSRFIIRIPLGSDHLRADELESGVQAGFEPHPQSKPHALPMEEEYDDADTPQTKAAKGKSRYKVLIAEDEVDIRTYLKEELSDDYRVELCSNGREAYERILNDTPDLVISDLMMPEMDGLALCRKIRQSTQVNHVPVILLTAKSKPEDRQEGLEQGADAYMVKPFNTALLKSTIANLIANRRLLRNKFSGAQEQEGRLEGITMKSNDEKLMAKIMKVVNEQMANSEFNVEMLAAEVGLSRVHIHRKLKELTNLSARDFIRNIRLQQAARLLAEDRKLSISEVAYATGYSNLSHFSSSFREKYGLTPTEYAERNGTKE
ncbi:MAG: response regulator [Bacteroides sp.]|nr:response regulator [Bacteroides sp.]